MDQRLHTLLRFLCPEDPDEAGRLYVKLHQKLEGYARFKGVSDPLMAADSILDVAARKIEEGVIIPDIQKYCWGIARLRVLEILRNERREISAFLEHLRRREESIDDEAAPIMTFMKLCFEQLPQVDRNLLNSYCEELAGHSRAKHRLQVAKDFEFTISAARIKVSRLRRRLDDCVRTMVSES